ncbi:hypothetical protein AWE51_04380 [Aquimarina aggregata]|uniref:SnoaL-like domain-containing protein n=1 Tax=Aquimarina aggregata TaxID=1642818 RepID=A0A163CRP7_9FLAO|nr:hypothetical protein [Aquimarina aggregata]KZS42693.1 hypothetical protein AWE51_04380 [Aquimarina aggregata]
MTQSKNNKQIILDFYKNVIGLIDLDYADKIVTENYIQHNPMVKTGKKGFLEAISFLKQLPKPENPVKPFIRILSDNEYVAAHLQVAIADEQKVVLDLFRIENGLIAEHWDAIKTKSVSSANGNPEVEGTMTIKNLENTSSNKSIIDQYSKAILLNRDFSLISNYVSKDIIQHHPKIKNGLQSLTQYYSNVFITKVHKIIGEGNFILTQSSGIVDSKPSVIYDIYRLQNLMIEEHWSIDQPIPEKMAHNNGMI